MEREVLVVGGTGMMRPAVHDLINSGARVILVARRPDKAATATAARGRLSPVAANWSEPDRLADAVKETMGGRAIAEALLWIHTPYDEGVHRALDPLLATDATVVQLWGSAGADPRRSRPLPDQYTPPRSYRSVVLGFADTAEGTRWLTNREISDGALRGLHDPQPQQIVGRVEPWSDHP